MEHHLCISVTFLDTLFHGKGDGDRPEWPPAPMRLFQALLAGSAMGIRFARWPAEGGDELREAFEWLERQPPPRIIAPRAELATNSYTLFVPTNDGDETFDRQDRLSSKIVRPHLFIPRDGDQDSQYTLQYVWRISDQNWSMARPHAELLSRESRHLMALGWGIDQVVGDGRILSTIEVDRLSGERWQPYANDMLAAGRLRVPVEGSLRALISTYKSFRVRLDDNTYNTPLEFNQFDVVRYVKTTQFPHRPHACFELPIGLQFRQEASVEIAAMLRSLVCRDVNRHDFRDQFGDDTEVYLAGHINGEKRTPPRFSYLPLPTIDHEHADGMIRRLLITEPYGGDGSRARWATQRLSGQVLTDNQGNERGQLLGLWRSSSRRVVNLYVGKHIIWSTVTPVVLPGFDDKQLVKAQKMFIRAARQAGVSTDGLVNVTLRKAPFWTGSQHPRHYRRPLYLKHFPAWHVKLEFQEPMSGPLVIGAGRHIGLGIFAGLYPQ